MYGMENKIIIRKAQMEDISQLANIMSLSWKAAFADMISTEELESFANEERFRMILSRMHNERTGNLYIAFWGDKPVGELFWFFNPDENVNEILSVHTLPEVWGRRVGQELVKQAEKDIGMTDEKNIEIWTFERNIRACKFYAKVGYVNSMKTRKSDFGNLIEVQYTKNVLGGK